MALFTHFSIIYFLNVYIGIYILIFHFTLKLPFFYFRIEVVRQIALVIGEIYLQLVCLPCLRNRLLHNQINLFIIFCNLAENYRLAHDLIYLIERIVALIIQSVLHYIAMAIVFRYILFLFISWFIFVFHHFTLDIRCSHVRCYFRCVPVYIFCLLHFYNSFIFIFYVYLGQLIISDCRLIV